MEIKMKEVNIRLLELWERTPDEYLNGLMPFFVDKFESHRVTFIGLNPSFSEKGYEFGLRNTAYKEIAIRDFYSFPKSALFNLEKALDIERKMMKNYPYFKPFGELLTGTAEKWNHIDLFYIRETSQNKLGSSIFQQSMKLNDFGRSQMDISKIVLEGIAPKAIVVVNALASNIFKKEYEISFDEYHGCYFTQISERSIPTFLTSMLSGQRALDTFSRERLSWHIRKVLKEVN
jgi:hypothetical protein